ncbi:MAG: hypothetical protein WD691_12195 [Acidimicrobiales bacterium]
MTDQDPYGRPTRADLPAVDPTRAVPTTGGPPGGRPPRPTAGPPGGGDRQWWILGVLAALILIVGLVALLLSGNDDSSSTADTTTTSAESTTTTSSTSTTVESTTTSEESTTTTSESPRSTVAPGLCRSGESDDPDTSVQVLYQAYTLDDRVCAYQLGTQEAVDTLFAIPGRGGGWTYQGCTEGEDDDEHIDCAFTFDGGATHFRTSYTDDDEWIVFDVYQTVD